MRYRSIASRGNLRDVRICGICRVMMGVPMGYYRGAVARHPDILHRCDLRQAAASALSIDDADVFVHLVGSRLYGAPCLAN